MEKSRAVFNSSTFIQLIVTPVSRLFLHVNMAIADQSSQLAVAADAEWPHLPRCH